MFEIDYIKVLSSKDLNRSVIHWFIMTLLVFAQIRQRVEKSMNAMLSKSRFQIVARKKGLGLFSNC